MPRIGLMPCLALIVAALSACGAGSDADQVRATVTGYAKAVAAHDYQAICDRYFSPKLVDGLEQQLGLPCESAVRPEISSTKNPKLEINAVDVHGDRATARVHTSADNQAPSDDTMALVKLSGSWRIVALATPGPEPSGP